MNPKILSQVPADYYSKGIKSNPFQMIWHGWKWKSLKPHLKDLEGEILDIGCADGTLTAKIDSFLPKANLTGLDLYFKAIKLAKKIYPQVNFVVADARSMPFGDNNFDAVVCVEALEHIPNNHLVLKEIKRVLKKSGKLIVVQDTDNWVFKIIWFIWTRWKGKVWNNAHIACLTPKKLAKLLSSSGFKIKNKKFSHLGLEVTFSAVKI